MMTRCGPPIISFLRTKVHCLIFGTRINHVFVCVNLGDKIMLRGEECKSREKFIFSEKG